MPKSREITIGDKYGRLTVLECIGSQARGKRTYTFYRCRCECGNMVDAAGTLLGKNVNSCGCLRIDVVARPVPIGTRFERLTVVNLLGRIAGKGPVYLCKCDCGNEVTAYENNLKQGSKKSCGCMHTDVARENVAKGIAANFVGGTNLGSIRSKVLYRNNTSGVRGVSWNPLNKNWISDTMARSRLPQK